MSSSQFTILFVCTANLCRSQLAEARLREHLPAHSGVDVASAGTRAIDGTPIPDRFAPAFDQGLVHTLSASQATPALLGAADLVLAMTRAQRSEVVQIMPRSVAHAYTLTQFVEMAEAALVDDPQVGIDLVTSSDPGVLLEAVKSRRRTRAGRTAGDIADPAHGGPRQLRKVSSSISTQVDRLAMALRVRSVIRQAGPAQHRALTRRAAFDAAS